MTGTSIEAAWRRLSCGEGTKGARLHDWVYLELADLDAGEYNSALDGLWTRGLLPSRFRRRPAALPMSGRDDWR